MGLRSTYRRCRFWQKIIFSDEVHFDIGRYVNKQNLWHRKPARIHRKADAPKTSHCLARILVQREYEQGEAVTVNGDHHRVILNEVLFTKVEGEVIGNIRFEQDDATCHTAEATLDVLWSVFEDRIISRRAAVLWPSRSCYLTQLNY